MIKRNRDLTFVLNFQWEFGQNNMYLRIVMEYDVFKLTQNHTVKVYGENFNIHRTQGNIYVKATEKKCDLIPNGTVHMQFISQPIRLIMWNFEMFGGFCMV